MYNVHSKRQIMSYFMSVDINHFFRAKFLESVVPEHTKPEVYHSFIEKHLYLIFVPIIMQCIMLNNSKFFNQVDHHYCPYFLFDCSYIFIDHNFSSFSKVIPSVQLLFGNFYKFIFEGFFEFFDIFHFLIFN